MTGMNICKKPNGPRIILPLDNMYDMLPLQGTIHQFLVMPNLASNLMPDVRIAICQTTRLINFSRDAHGIASRKILCCLCSQSAMEFNLSQQPSI
jgi:hypothetical protein